MSAYSGKCDVADYLSDATDEYLHNAQIYIGDHIVPLRIDNQHDLAPYYPYLVYMGGWSINHHVIHISTESYIDQEERDHLTWKLEDTKKYYRKCKRKKIPYNSEEAARRISFLREPTELEHEIAHRVKSFGEKATINGLHDTMHEYYRNLWLEEMIRLGWDKQQAAYWIWKDWKILVEDMNDK